MATKAGDIYIEITAEFAKLNDQMTQLKSQLAAHTREMKSSLEGVNSAFEMLSKGIEGVGAALGIGAIVEAGKQFAEFVEQTLASVDSLGKVADEVGVTTTQLQGLQYAATQSSTSQATLNTGLERLTRTIGDAAGGARTQQKAFVDLGVSFLDASGKARNTHDVLIDVADAISRLPTAAARARAEIELFGRSGQEMDEFLSQGGSAITDLEGKARSLGLVLSEEDVKAAQKASAEIEGLKLEWEKLTDHIVLQSIPAIRDFIGWLARISAPSNEINLKLVGLRTELAAAENSLKSSQASNWFGMWDSAIERTKQHIKELEQQITELEGHFEDVTGEAGARGLRPASTKKLPPPKVTGGVDKAAEEAKRIKDVEDALKAEIEALHGDDEAIKLNSSLRSANVTAASAAGKEIAALVHQYESEKKALDDAKEAQRKFNEEQNKANALLDELAPKTDKYIEEIEKLEQYLHDGAITQQQYAQAIAEVQKQIRDSDPAQKKLIEDQKTVGDAITKFGTDLFDNLAKAMMDSGSAADRWRNFMKAALQDVMNILDDLAKKLLEPILSNFLSGIIGGAVGGGVGSVVPGASMGTGLGRLATGGQMKTGDWAIVGEAGPELVYADTPGNVLSADRTRGIFGGGPGNGPTAYIDARGADVAAVARIEAGLRALNYSIEQRAVGAVQSQRKRGGAFAASFRR
jgi:hypothetical protein